MVLGLSEHIIRFRGHTHTLSDYSRSVKVQLRKQVGIVNSYVWALLTHRVFMYHTWRMTQLMAKKAAIAQGPYLYHTPKTEMSHLSVIYGCN